MAAIIRGEALLFDPKPHAVYNEVDKVYRFYYSYRSYLPISYLPPSIGANEDQVLRTVQANCVKAEVWIPIYSPVLSFPDKSVIYLRGRMLMPEIDPRDQESVFVLLIEAIYAQLRRVIPLASRSAILSVPHNRPELSVIGKILELPSDSQTGHLPVFLLEAKDNVGNKIERFRIG